MVAHKDELEAYRLDYFNKFAIKPKDGDFLYHYTDLNGLIGIVTGKSFWMSDHRFLNDSAEFDHGIKLATDIFKKRQSEFSDGFQNILYILINWLEKGTGEKTVFYIACFSKASDSLDQWKGYGKTPGSVRLGFKYSDKNRSHPWGKSRDMHKYSVIYDDLEKERIFCGMVDYWHDFHLKHGGGCKWSTIAGYMLGLVRSFAIICKHKSYKSEEEVRLFISHSSTAARYFIDNEIKIKHRASGNLIIPYIETKDFLTDVDSDIGIECMKRTDILPLKNVMVGPMATQDAIISSIQVFLENQEMYKYEMHAIDVVKSEIPFRG